MGRRGEKIRGVGYLDGFLRSVIFLFFQQCQTHVCYWISRLSWWHHEMETFAVLLAICAGNSPVNSPHKGQWRGALFSLIYARINGWVNNGDASDLRRHRAHYDVTVMIFGRCRCSSTVVTPVKKLMLSNIDNNERIFSNPHSRWLDPMKYKHGLFIELCLVLVNV